MSSISSSSSAGDSSLIKTGHTDSFKISSFSKFDFTTREISDSVFHNMLSFLKPKEYASLHGVSSLYNQKSHAISILFCKMFKIQIEGEIGGRPLPKLGDIQKFQKIKAELLTPLEPKLRRRKEIERENLEWIELLPPEIYIKYDKKPWKPIRLEMELGAGGSKRAIEIGDGKALVVPNTDVGFGKIVSWSRICHEEVIISDFCTKIGLLSPKSIKVNIALPGNLNLTFPVYVSNTFSSLGTRDKEGMAERGIFILDKKSPDSSTWTSRDKIFKTSESRLNNDDGHWDHFFTPLMDDIIIACRHNLSIPIDAENIAIVRRGEESETIHLWQARMFIFDISKRTPSISLSNLSEVPLPFTESERERAKNKARMLMAAYVATIFRQEFESNYLKPEVEAFRNVLVSRYQEMLEKRIMDF